MRRGRVSLKDHMRAGLALQRAYAAAVPDDDPRRAANQERLDRLSASIAPKRERVRRPVDGRPATDIEGPVINAVGDLLNVHPRVLFAVRQNSGSMPYQRSDGRMAPVWFYKIFRKPEKLTIVDFWGFLDDGRPFAMECKKPSWTEPRDEREFKQQAFLKMIASIGGISGFVCSVTDAQKLLT